MNAFNLKRIFTKFGTLSKSKKGKRKMADVTKSGILSALKKVEHPDLNRDLLILNSIKKVEQEDSELTVEIILSIPPNAVTDELKNKIIESIKTDFPVIKKVNLNIETKVTSQKDEKKEELLPGVKNTIAVASGKGGVGKSTVAVNLAVALAKDGASVGLLDADIYGPSIPTMLGMTDKPQIYQDNKTKKIIPLENYGIKLISIGFFVEDNAPVIWRGPMASGALKQFMSDVDWGELDYLIFDMPPGTGDVQLTLVQSVPLTGAIIVTTPQEVSLVDARKAFKMFGRVNVPIVGVVENMSFFVAPDTQKKYDIFGTGGGSKMAEDFKAPFLGGIPIEPNIRVGGDKGVPVVYDIPDSETSKVFRQISRNFVEQVNLANVNKSSDVEIVLGDED